MHTVNAFISEDRIRLEIGIPVTTTLGFQYRASTRLRYQWFRNRFDDKPQIGTPIRPILVWNELWNCLTHFSCLTRPRSAFLELIKKAQFQWFCILTIKRVLHMLFAGWNHVFDAKTTFSVNIKQDSFWPVFRTI